MITIPGRIPISIHPLFWLIAFFIGWMWTSTLTGALICVAVILFSVLFHEFGHAITAMLFGQKTRIELAAFGGFTYREGRKLKLWEEFLVVLNGPIAGFLLFLIAYTVYRNMEIESQSVLFLIKFAFVANLFWTVINLVPVLPLDGGHLLSIILEGIFGFKGVKIAIICGLVIAVSISIFFFVAGMFLIGALFLILTFESFRSLRYYKIFTEQDRDTNLQEMMKAADADFQAGRSDDALAKLEEVRERTKEGIIYTVATQEMAEIYRNQERYEEAYQLLIPLRKTLSGEHLATFHFLAHMNGDYKTVTEIGNKCFQDNPSADTALINALAYGALSSPEPAVGWLECSLREGLTSVKEAISREEFNSIRNDPRFHAFEEMHKS
jgi:stage IV sporulation protein FB